MKHRYVLFIIVLFCVAIGSGCKKQSASSAESGQSYQQLPEATNVLAALDQKNYDEAIAAFAKLKESVSTEEQRSEYSRLNQQVRDKLLEASTSDPKAQQALQAYGVMTRGR